MATVIYMKITGEKQGLIEGDCTKRGVERLITCFNLDNLMEVARDDAGVPTGRRIHSPLTISTQIGSHTPHLLQACLDGEKLEVEIWLRRFDAEGMEVTYFSILLSNAVVIRSRQWFPTMFVDTNKPYEHMHDLTFTFETITWTHVLNERVVTDHVK